MGEVRARDLGLQAVRAEVAAVPTNPAKAGAVVGAAPSVDDEAKTKLRQLELAQHADAKLTVPDSDPGTKLMFVWSPVPRLNRPWPD